MEQTKLESPPKRPQAAFFLFMAKERENGVTFTVKEAGAKWQALPEEEKKKYHDEYNKNKELYMSYLEEMGISRTSTGSKKKPTSENYKAGRIRAICGMNEKIKVLSGKQCQGLSAVAEAFVKDLGEAIDKKLRALDKRMVTYEIVLEVLELQKKFGFVTEMPEYEAAIEEIVKEREEEKIRRKTEKVAEEEKKKSTKKKSVAPDKTEAPLKDN